MLCVCTQKLLSTKFDQFHGYAQQDAQEFLTSLLDVLIEVCAHLSRFGRLFCFICLLNAIFSDKLHFLLMALCLTYGGRNVCCPQIH